MVAAIMVATAAVGFCPLYALLGDRHARAQAAGAWLASAAVSERSAHATSDLDRAAFEALVASESPGLYRFALSLVRNVDAAEELVQETFLRALEKQARFRGESSAATWLHRILHNLAVDRARRAGHEILVEAVEERWRDDSYSVDAATVVERAQTSSSLACSS